MKNVHSGIFFSSYLTSSGKFTGMILLYGKVVAKLDSHLGDSTLSQLLCIMHQIYSAFEEFPSREARAVFLDISKAFDKVWHDSLLFKLKYYGISGSLFTVIKGFSSQSSTTSRSKRKKLVLVLNDYRCASRLRPWSFIFLIYINDLVDNISSEAKLFADDTSLFTVVYDVDIVANKLNRDLEIISTWAYQWKMQFNPDKNKLAVHVIFSQKKDTPVHPPLFLNGSEVVIKTERKHLGMILNSKLTF